MAKPVMIEGVAHRWRRGRLVPIPPEWLGKVTSHQTINARPSKLTHKMRRTSRRPYRSTKMYRQDAETTKRHQIDEEDTTS